MANLNNLLVDSHYHMPWIIWKATVQYTLSSGDFGIYQINHNLPFTPLIFGSWSTSSNFLPSYDLTDSLPGWSGSGQPPLTMLASAGTSTVAFNLTNNQATSTTFYIRVMGFAPPGYTGEVTPVDYVDADFAYNSQYRYQKIIASGLATGSVAHNLGYLPQAMVWTTSSGSVTPSSDGILTTTTLSLPDSSQQFYYYIYGDRIDG